LRDAGVDPSGWPLAMDGKRLGQDLAQARGWYQKALEWGSPEAQRQLDALASYR